MKAIYLLTFILLLAITTKSQTRSGSVAPLSQEIIFNKPFPNPANSYITFTFENGYDKNLSLQIYNFIGKKVYELRTVSPRTVVGVNDLYRGVYIFQIRDKSGKVIDSGRFTVER